MAEASDWFATIQVPLQSWINDHFFWLAEHVRPWFGALRAPAIAFPDGVAALLGAVPPPLLLLLLFLSAWQLNGLLSATFLVLVMTLVDAVGVWGDMLQTFSFFLAAVLLGMAVGLPIGFAMARSDRVQAVLTPALDLMQTLPAFVYLVPIVLVVGIGSLPGVLVAFVFAVPPIIRLTNLGLRNVPVPMFEAAQALGASPTKILVSVEIPNALPTILLGVNQTIMMALAMVTYASMIGVGGLGRLVLQGIGRLDMGLAMVGGLGIAALAILCSTLFATRPRERRGPAWAGSPYALLKTMFGQVTPRGDARLPQRRYAPQGDRSHV